MFYELCLKTIVIESSALILNLEGAIHIWKANFSYISSRSSILPISRTQGMMQHGLVIGRYYKT